MPDFLSLKLYPLLNRRSKDALRKDVGPNGLIHTYAPRKVLLQRLAERTGWSLERVEKQLHEERRQVLAYPGVQIYPDTNFS